MAAACAGEAVEGTQAHEKTADGFAVFVQEAAGGEYAWSVDGVHFKLRQPNALAKVNTVFCLDAPVEVPEGVCAFEETTGVGVVGVQLVETGRSEGPTFPRIGQSRGARLVDPATGSTIAEHTVTTRAPKCDAFVGEPIAENFRAMVPTPIAFADWATGELGVEK